MHESKLFDVIRRDANTEKISSTYSYLTGGSVSDLLQLDLSDVTFMLPYCTDSSARARNIGLTLIWLINNTNAKIMIYWCESEHTLKYFGDAYLPEVSDDFLDRWSNIALKQSSQQSAIPIEDENDHKFLCEWVELFIASVIDNMKAPDSLSYNDYIFKAKNIPNDAEEFYRPNLVSRLTKEAHTRVKFFIRKRNSIDPFHRTKYINEMLRWVDTPIVCNHDVDVLISTSTLLESAFRLRYSTIDFVYPYAHMQEGRRGQVRVYPHDVESQQLTAIAALNGDFSRLLLYGETSNSLAAYGATFFAKTDSYRSSGGEIEDFVSWGPDDVERFTRFSRLGYLISRIDNGLVFHLEHPRSSDSGADSPNAKFNENFWKKLQLLSTDALLGYLSNMAHIKKYGWEIKLGDQLMKRINQMNNDGSKR